MGQVSAPHNARKIDSLTSITPEILLNSPRKQQKHTDWKLSCFADKCTNFGNNKCDTRRELKLDRILHSLKQKNLLSSDSVSNLFANCQQIAAKFSQKLTVN